MKLLMKWAQLFNNYQKSSLGGSMMKQFVLTDKEFNFLDGGLNCFLKNDELIKFLAILKKYVSENKTYILF